MKRILRITLVASALLVIWLMLYAWNSVAGGYALKPVTYRAISPEGGSIDYRVYLVWRPLVGRFKDGSFKTDFLGYLFSPLILADRSFVHRSIDLAKPGDWDAAQALRTRQLHPDDRAQWKPQ